MLSPLHAAHAHGTIAALERFGFKQAAEELRLKIPTRTFHGLEAGHKAESKTPKRASEETSDMLAEFLASLAPPRSPDDQKIPSSQVNRSPNWGPASNMAAGESAHGNFGGA